MISGDYTKVKNRSCEMNCNRKNRIFNTLHEVVYSSHYNCWKFQIQTDTDIILKHGTLLLILIKLEKKNKLFI